MARSIQGNIDKRVVEDETVFAGDQYVLEVTVKDEAGDTVDISGATGTYGVYDDGSEQFTKSISVTDGANGVFEVTVPSSDTQGLTFTLEHEAQINTSSLGDRTVFEGDIIIKETNI